METSGQFWNDAERRGERSQASQFSAASVRIVLRCAWVTLFQWQEDRAHYVRRVRNKGGVAMNNGYIYREDELFPYKHV